MTLTDSLTNISLIYLSHRTPDPRRVWSSACAHSLLEDKAHTPENMYCSALAEHYYRFTQPPRRPPTAHKLFDQF